MRSVLVCIVSMAVGTMARCGNPLSKRMADDKRWTVRKLDVELEGSYCYDGKCRQSGRLYTWESARRACQWLGQGWRLPTDEDWRHLAALYGGGAVYRALLTGGDSGFGALLGALPAPRKKRERPRWKIRAAVEFVDAILEADRKAPRKQRHTAHRIWVRIQNELPACKIAERTVREYVQTRRAALGLLVREVCIPQSYAWGAEAQIDWYEAYGDLAGERTKLQVFAMRSMASRASFRRAYGPLSDRIPAVGS